MDPTEGKTGNPPTPDVPATPTTENVVNIEEKVNGIVANIFNKMFGKDNAKPPEPNENKIKDNTKEDLLRKNIEQELLIQSYKEKEAKQKLIEEETKKAEFNKKVDDAVKELIKAGVVASTDEANLNIWKNLFNSDFDNTSALLKKEIEKIEAKGQNSTTTNPRSPFLNQDQIVRQANSAAVDFMIEKKWGANATANKN